MRRIKMLMMMSLLLTASSCSFKDAAETALALWLAVCGAFAIGIVVVIGLSKLGSSGKEKDNR